jgi:hypothetical protein
MPEGFLAFDPLAEPEAENELPVVSLNGSSVLGISVSFVSCVNTGVAASVHTKVTKHRHFLNVINLFAVLTQLERGFSANRSFRSNSLAYENC